MLFSYNVMLIEYYIMFSIFFLGLVLFYGLRKVHKERSEEIMWKLEELRHGIEELEHMSHRLTRIEEALDIAIIDLENSRYKLQQQTKPLNQQIINDPVEFFDIRKETALIDKV